MLYGPGHVVVHGNPPFRELFGAGCLGLPAAEALLDLPRAAFELMDLVYREGRPLARWITLRGAPWRLTVVPRRMSGPATSTGSPSTSSRASATDREPEARLAGARPARWTALLGPLRPLPGPPRRISSLLSVRRTDPPHADPPACATDESVPRTQVAGDRQRHFGSPAERAMDVLPEPAEERDVRAIADRLAGRIGARRDLQPDDRQEPAEPGDRDVRAPGRARFGTPVARSARPPDRRPPGSGPDRSAPAGARS